MRVAAKGRASARFVAVYAFAYAALWLALLTPAIITLALRAAANIVSPGSPERVLGR